MDYKDERALLSDALRSLTMLCEQAREDQLELPTPCAGWDLRALLEHMTGQHRGMVAALSGSGRDLSNWRPLSVGADRADLLGSLSDLRLALGDDAGIEEAWMPEINPDAPLPLRLVLLAHLVDTVAHGWDVAASIGVPVNFSDAVVATAYEVATGIPDGPERDAPGAAFAHALPITGDQPSLAGFLALLGRDAGWPRGA